MEEMRDEISLDTYRASCRDVRIAVRSHVSNREQELLDNPSSTRFYNYVNNNIGRPRQPVRLLDNVGGIIAAGHDTAEAFNAEFTKNFARAASASGMLHEVTAGDKAWRASVTDILAALLITSNSAPGPDLISGKLLHRLAPVITRPVATIFQASLEQDCFPSAWKQAIVVPIYKGAGPKTSPSNYRPVTL
jgi:hypothetical protein